MSQEDKPKNNSSSGSLLKMEISSSFAGSSFINLNVKTTHQGNRSSPQLNKSPTNDYSLKSARKPSYLLPDCVVLEKSSTNNRQISHSYHSSIPSTPYNSKKALETTLRIDPKLKQAVIKKNRNQQYDQSDQQQLEDCLPIIRENNLKITQQISAKKEKLAGDISHRTTGEQDEEQSAYAPQTKQFSAKFSVQVNKNKAKQQAIVLPSNQQGYISQTAQEYFRNTEKSNGSGGMNSSSGVRRSSHYSQDSSNNSNLSQSAGIKQQNLENSSNGGGGVYQLDSLIRNPLREAETHTSKLQPTNSSSSFQAQHLLQTQSPISKFSKTDESASIHTPRVFGSEEKGKSLFGMGKAKNNIVSTRDMQHVSDLSASNAEQHKMRFQTKTEQNLSLLLSPRGSSALQKKRISIFDVKKTSSTDLKYRSKVGQEIPQNFVKGSINSSRVSLQHISPAGGIISQPQSTQDLSSNYAVGQQFSSSSLSQKNYFSTHFLGEFIEAVRQANLSGGTNGNNVNMQITGGIAGTHIIQAVHSEIQKMLADQKSVSNENTVRSSLAELVYSLKKAHPSLFTGQPSGRAEVQVLQEWLESTLSQVIENKEGSVEERFQRVDDALMLSFNELVRQVSYQCKERGMLMLSVFSCYFSLTKKMSLYEQDEKRRLKIESEIEKLQMQKTADEDMESQTKQIKSLQELLQLEKMKTQGLIRDLRSAEDREKAAFGKYEKLKAFNDLAKVQVIKMKREIDDLRHRLSCKEAFQQKKLEKVLIEYKTTLKKQVSSSFISSRLEEADQKLLNSIADLSAPPPQQKDQDEIDEKMQLSFSEIIKEADSNTRMISNVKKCENYYLNKEISCFICMNFKEVIIKSVMEEKSTALICQEMQTDPMLSLTYNKSVKCQTDLDFVDSKFDKVFSTKKQVEEYVREQQLKAELFSLEEFASEQQDISIDQDVGEDGGGDKNISKPVLSSIFAGLPIKKLKKKITKNNLNKFIENIGILYNYMRQQDAQSGKDIKQATLQEILTGNKTTKDDNPVVVQNPKEFMSMREIQEVDELQEDHETPSVSKIERTKRLSKRGSIIAASLSALQSGLPEMRRASIRQHTINISNKPSSKERSILKDSIKQSLEMTFHATSTTTELIQVIQKQQLIIEKLQNLALPEESLDNSFNDSGKKRTSSFTNLNSNLFQEPPIQTITTFEQHYGIGNTQAKPQTDGSQYNQQQYQAPPSNQQMQEVSSGSQSLQEHLKSVLVNNNIQPSSKATKKRMSILNPMSQGTIVTGAQKKAISFISSLQSPQQKNSARAQVNSLPSSSSIENNKKEQVNSSSQQMQRPQQQQSQQQQQQQRQGTEEDLPNFNSFYGKTNPTNPNTSIGNMDQDEEYNNNPSMDEEDIISPDLQQPTEYQDNEFKQQIVGLLQLYNMEIEKNSNLRESLEELIKLLREIYLFAKLLFMHIKKTQKHTHKSIIEGFIQQFTSLKWKLPKEFDSNFEKEIMKEDKEDMNKKLLRLKFSNKRSAQRFIAHVQKNQAFTKLSMFDKNAHFGFIIANKIKESGVPKKFAAFLPLKNTLKYIQNLVDERVRMVREKRLPTDQDMPIFTFNKFLQLFGFRRVAESKYTQFMFSVMHYQSIFRVNMFARLLTITNDKKANYTTEEMEKYFNAYEFIINISTMGVQNPQHSETDSTLNIALLKAMDYTKVVLEKIMPFEDIAELRAGLEAIKDVDQKSASKTLMVDFDVFMSKVLQKYRSLMNKTQLFVKNAFFAADLDGNGRINLNEFLTLFRHIMPARFNLMKCIQMFEDGADIITEDQKNLSFEKFTALCIDFNLFTTAMQDKYIRVASKEEITKQLSVLRANWQEENKKIEEKLEILKPFVVSQSYKSWIEILKVLEARLNEENIVEENQRPILIAFKLLNDELDRLIEEGKKGNEDNEDDDDDDDNDLFNFKDDDDNELSSLLKTINNKNVSLHQIAPVNYNQNNNNQITVSNTNSNTISGNEEQGQKDLVPGVKTSLQK